MLAFAKKKKKRRTVLQIWAFRTPITTPLLHAKLRAIIEFPRGSAWVTITPELVMDDSFVLL